MMGLTLRQAQALDAIRQSIETNGYPPTLRELGDAIGIRSTNGVMDHLKALERKGYIERGMGAKSRDIRLVGQTTVTVPSEGAVEAVAVNVYGRVAASNLVSEGDIIDRIAVDPRLAAGKEVFGVRVSGDAMFQMGIMAGDYVLVHRTPHAERGAVVLALIGDDAIVRVFYAERDFVRLQAASPSAPPVLVRASDWRPNSMLVGKVVGLFRRFL